MRELVESWQPWHRRLWDLGTVLAMHEAVEAADWTGRHVLSPASLAWYLRESLLPRLKMDAAIGDGALRREIHKTFTAPIKSGARGQRTLGLLAELTADGYLHRWRDLVAKGSVHVERSARCIASHLLDAGFHQDFVYGQLKSRLDTSATAVEMIELLIELEGQGEREYEGLVVLRDKIPAAPSALKSSLWIPPEEVGQRLASEFPDVPPVRATGGLLFRVQARDPMAALHEITERYDRIRNRVRYRRGQKTLDVHPRRIYLSGNSVPQDFRRGDPAVTVLSLERVEVLYDIPEPGTDGGRIDDALELAAPLTGSSPSTAVAGAWAALESLLFCDTDEADREQGRAVAADRAAALVAAGWPRAELTALSHVSKIKTADPRLRQDLCALGKNNRERAGRLAVWLTSKPAMPSCDLATAAAFARVQELAGAPGPTLRRIDGYLRGSLRRLYRQRNIVLHGGSTRSVALAATVRTAGPLVGVALDRLAHGRALLNIAPLDLAGRAELSLRMVGDKDGWDLHDLLGT
ncbi:hypothetical protein [Nonomuraea endophytica]|uniref:hypothetical protein n=1 Tax=Nonomuraea endophytica TaxID=714136 RepID=UPI0037C92D5F